MIIRQAEPRDADAIAEIWNEIIDKTTLTFTTDRKCPQSLIQDIATRKAAFQVAEIKGQVAGFATYFQFRGGVGYAHTMEHTIHLAPTARGHGAGRALMSVLEKAARQQNVHSLWAGITADNPAGVAFHSQIGFSHVARLPEVGFKWGKWYDLILMQKRL